MERYYHNLLLILLNKKLTKKIFFSMEESFLMNLNIFINLTIFVQLFDLFLEFLGLILTLYFNKEMINFITIFYLIVITNILQFYSYLL